MFNHVKNLGLLWCALLSATYVEAQAPSRLTGFSVNPIPRHQNYDSLAGGINNLRQLAGFTSVGGYPNLALYWASPTGTPFVPFDHGNRYFQQVKINDTGDIIGQISYTVGPFPSFFYSTSSGLQEILPNEQLSGYNSVRAKGLNNAGAVVGQASTPSEPAGRAFVWIDNTFSFLPESSTNPESAAAAIDDSGTIVGYVGGESRIPVRWSLISLQAPEIISVPNASSNFVEAVDISRNGNFVLVRNSYVSSGGERCFLVHANGTVQEIFPPSGNKITCIATNNRGDVTGTFLPAGAQTWQTRPFLVSRGRFYDILSFIADSSIHIGWVTDMNDAGEIVAQGYNSTGSKGFLIAPVYSSSTPSNEIM